MSHAFVTTRLDYCNSLYYGVSQSSLSRLQLVQNAAARLLSGTRKYEPVIPILSALHWLLINYRMDFKILLFVYKALNNLAPQYLTDLLRPYTPSRTLRSSDLCLLIVPRSWLKKRGDRAFATAGPKLWNSLPLHIRLAPSISAFKSALKTYLYSVAFNTPWSLVQLLCYCGVLNFASLVLFILFLSYYSILYSTLVNFGCFLNVLYK